MVGTILSGGRLSGLGIPESVFYQALASEMLILVPPVKVRLQERSSEKIESFKVKECHCRR